MELPRRYRIVAGSILVVGLVLLGWQLLRPDTAQPPAQPVPKVTTMPAATDTPAPEAAADVAAPATASEDATASIVRGRAVDAVTGEPVSKFEIRWSQPPGEPWQSFKSQKRTFETRDGRFEYTDVPPGRWNVTVTARGYQRFELSAFKVTGEAQELQLPLQKGHTVRGRIYDEASGAGIAASLDVLDPSASVATRRYGWDKENVAGQDGSFVIEGMSPGRTTLVVEAKGYTTRTVLVEVAANTPPLSIGLSSGGMLVVRFTNAAGAPIAHGRLTLSRADTSTAGLGQADADGKFEFRGLDPGKYQLAGRHGTAIVTKDITLGEGTENVHLALPAGRTIRGMVTGLRSEALGQVGISVRREGENMWSHNRVNQRGEFELNDVAPGPVRVVADINGKREISKPITMPADADVTVNIDFPPGASLSGRVTRNNKPLSDIDVLARPAETGSRNWNRGKTSRTGTYTLPDMDPGEYIVMVGSFASKPLQVSGEATYDIDLPGGDLTGSVLDDSAGTPVDRATVDVSFAEGVTPVRLNVLSDPTGQFKIAGVVPAEYVLTVYKPGYRLYRERISIDAQGGAPVIRLRQDRGVEIKARDAATGKPVRELMMFESIGDRTGVATNLQLDDNGVGYLPSGLAGSKLTLIALGLGQIEISAWNGTPLDLRFEPARQ